MTTAALDNCYVRVKPSKALSDYISSIGSVSDMPKNILSFKSAKESEVSFVRWEHKVLINPTDKEFIETLCMEDDKDDYVVEEKPVEGEESKKFLLLEDLHWLKEFIDSENAKTDEKVYFHELFEGSNLVLPENKEVPRNPELEKRCIKLKAQQENRVYKAMTKNIDNVRMRHPEDTIAYQVKQINSQLIAIFQFIVSVLAGFAFGFIGIEVFVGSLDFGFRLLLGIMSALIVALAELYFLAKKLNEDLEFETKIKEKVN